MCKIFRSDTGGEVGRRFRWRTMKGGVIHGLGGEGSVLRAGGRLGGQSVRRKSGGRKESRGEELPRRSGRSRTSFCMQQQGLPSNALTVHTALAVIHPGRPRVKSTHSSGSCSVSALVWRRYINVQILTQLSPLVPAKGVICIRRCT